MNEPIINPILYFLEAIKNGYDPFNPGKGEPKFKLNEDPLIYTINSLGILPKEKTEEIFTGKSINFFNVNASLGKIYKAAKRKLWLDKITEKTDELQYIINNFKSSHRKLEPIYYIPCPGRENCQRIPHPKENKFSSQKEVNPEDIESEIPKSQLSEEIHHKQREFGIFRSRELAFLIDEDTHPQGIKTILILSFDPFHLINLLKNIEECYRSRIFWTKMAIGSSLISPRETPETIHAITGLHEWMENLFNIKRENFKNLLQWERWEVPDKEQEVAHLHGIDIYYSNQVLAFGWSALDNMLNREKTKAQTEQIINKKIFLLSPLFGKSTGLTKNEKSNFNNSNQITIIEDERQLTAKAIWETVLTEAILCRASDIHLEPYQEPNSKETTLIISLRKDNEMTFYRRCPQSVGEDIIRLALENSGVVRSNTEQGQDGRKTWTIKDPPHKTVDLRISVTPMKNTKMQEVVIRILDTGNLSQGLEGLELEEHELQIWRNALRLQESLILVSGPTGSGKSSTLFSAICEIYKNDPTRKITSIEDPIEFRFPFRTTQHEVNEEANMTFSTYIRRMVRNDIDTLLVGEIRDSETLNAALQLGLTGHQILSTIHAKSAPETILRIFDLKPSTQFIVSEVVKLIVAQRLAAKPCPFCTKHPKQSEAENLIQNLGGLPTVLTNETLWKKKYQKLANWIINSGCPSCRYTGNHGKIPIQEFLPITDQNKQFLRNPNIQELLEFMHAKNLPTLQTKAWEFAFLGKISIPEAAKLTNTLF